jgi:hypothetical protein
MRVFLAAICVALGLSACSDPYSPGQRAVGGGVIGAGTGAAVGGLAGGGRGAATGALVGGGVGAAGGALTTPERPYEPQYSYYRGSDEPRYGYSQRY